jgi:acetolactate synthase-1/2/3 large subunit
MLSAREPLTLPPELVQLVAGAGRIGVLAGAGAFGCAADLRGLVESLQAGLVTSTSGRGLLPESHPLLVMADPGLGGAAVLNEFFEACDLTIAIGWKASHNGTNGFRLRLPEDRLIHVDASESVLGANYRARFLIESDAGVFVRALRGVCERQPAIRSWTHAELAAWRRRISDSLPAIREPVIAGRPALDVKTFFSALVRALPPTACVVTDSGLHQMLARRYLEIRSARGLIVPTNFQSMGFGLPAAIGARIASPGRPVVAIVGDGSLAISAMELGTAVRERVALTVVLFNDESLGLIRQGQLREYGHACATELVNPDYRALVESMGVRFLALPTDHENGLDEVFDQALSGTGVTLLEVRLRDSSAIRRGRAVAAVRSFAKRSVGRLVGNRARRTKH